MPHLHRYCRLNENAVQAGVPRGVRRALARQVDYSINVVGPETYGVPLLTYETIVCIRHEQC